MCVEHVDPFPVHLKLRCAALHLLVQLLTILLLCLSACWLMQEVDRRMQQLQRGHSMMP